MRVITVGADGSADADDAAADTLGGGSSEEDPPPGLTVEQQMQVAQARAKRQAAREFARAYNLQKTSGVGVRVDAKVCVLCAHASACVRACACMSVCAYWWCRGGSFHGALP